MPSYYVIIHLKWDDKFRDTTSLLETIHCAFVLDGRPIEVVDRAEPLGPDSFPVRIEVDQPLRLTEEDKSSLISQAHEIARNWLFRLPRTVRFPMLFVWCTGLAANSSYYYFSLFQNPAMGALFWP